MPSLRDLRQQSGLTQAELATRSSLRQATISALENGHTRPHPATVSALATALQAAPEQIRAALSVTLKVSGESPDEPTDAIAQMGRDWPFLEGLDPDLRSGLAASLVAEWTHSSTALEGNTISAGDTLFVLTEGLTVSGKSLREHQELHGHAQALSLMAAWARARRAIRVEHLHQLHRAVQTGTTIDAFAPVGRWKVEPNGTNAITTGGTTQWHEYAEPRHVPVLVATWLKSLATFCRHPLLKTATHSAEDGRDPARREAALDAYTDAHLGFVAIHPYADGNGRMARLLANVPLLRAGLPPLLIDAAGRRKYLTLLGDYTLARGQPAPGENLALPGHERDALRQLFATCWESTLERVADFHRRQARRGSPPS